MMFKPGHSEGRERKKTLLPLVTFHSDCCIISYLCSTEEIDWGYLYAFNKKDSGEKSHPKWDENTDSYRSQV